MQCPVDQTELKIADRQGIEIDYCPQCRGVWLDRGELDKIIERQAATAYPAAPPSAGYPAAPPGPGYPPAAGYERYDDDDRRRGYGHGPYRKRRESWLGDLFDFD